MLACRPLSLCHHVAGGGIHVLRGRVRVEGCSPSPAADRGEEEGRRRSQHGSAHGTEVTNFYCTLSILNRYCFGSELWPSINNSDCYIIWTKFVGPKIRIPHHQLTCHTRAGHPHEGTSCQSKYSKFIGLYWASLMFHSGFPLAFATSTTKISTSMSKRAIFVIPQVAKRVEEEIEKYKTLCHVLQAFLVDSVPTGTYNSVMLHHVPPLSRNIYSCQDWAHRLTFHCSRSRSMERLSSVRALSGLLGTL